MDFELKGIEFFFTEGPVGGAIARIAYTARSSGPDFAALNRFRARVEKIQQNENAPPADRLNAFLEVLPELPGLFTQAKGETSIENVSVRAPTGEALVAFDKASFGLSLTGLKEAAAALADHAAAGWPEAVPERARKRTRCLAVWCSISGSRRSTRRCC